MEIEKSTNLARMRTTPGGIAVELVERMSTLESQRKFTRSVTNIGATADFPDCVRTEYDYIDFFSKATILDG